MTTTVPGALWRPYADQPLFVPEMTLGYAALEPVDADRLGCYLAALVARRGVVHTAVAFNAVYFGYDLSYGGYVGGPVDFDTFPRVAFEQTTAALPVGAMVNVATGADPLYAEVVYKEGAHLDLAADGDVPGWLSGAPAGARGPGLAPDHGEHPVLHERLVVDFEAFGPHLVASPARLDRLRRRGRWLDSHGHLLLAARYPSADDAEASDREFYARYLLAEARDLLLAGPLPLVLTADAGERQLAAGLRAALGTIADALAAIPALRMWRDYAFPRAVLAARLADPGPLGGSDLASLAASVGRVEPPPARRGLPTGLAVRYTAVGPLLHTVAGAQPQLVGAGYPAAICHTNSVIGDYARRDADDTGALPCGAHLRLDDDWQGGGVWRASNPPGSHARIDPLLPYGLGWLDSQPAEQPTDQPAAEDEVETSAALLTVTDSHLSWSVTLRLAHTLAGVAAVPDRVAAEVEAAGLVDAGLRLLLSHDGYDLDPAEATQSIRFTRAGPRVRLAEVDWPLEFFPGIVLTFTWQRGAVLLRARSTLLETPVLVDGELYEHRYDPAVLTRDTAPGCARRGRTNRGPLSLRERIMRAIRRLGLLDADGVAVLPQNQLADLVYGSQAGAAGTAALNPVITELLADATLSAEPAILAGSTLHWPVTSASTGPGDPDAAAEGIVTVLVWRPRPVTRPCRTARGAPADETDASPTSASQAGADERGAVSDDLARYVHTYEVAPFLRRLPDGQNASPAQQAEYRKLLARFGRVGDLPAGHTLVRGHTRERAR